MIATFAFVAGFLLGGGGEEKNISASSIRDVPENVDLTPVWKAWRIIDEKFVPAAVATTSTVATSTEEVNRKRVWGMIKGLAESLDDPYTSFLPPAEHQIFEEDMSGAFDGVGMEIAVRNEILTVVSPLKNTPAERAGIKSGDLILKIDGIITKGMSVSAAVNKIRGPRGSPVILTVLRQGWNAPREFAIVRETITIPTITTERLGNGIFKIQLMNFTANSPGLFRTALREFVESGDTKLILDLRGNPGGYLEAAVDIASWFLPLGNVVVTEDYDKHRANIIHRSRGYNIFNKNLKMVILVDRGSASASEILAEALRHWRVATIVGTNTFGKGSVQELVTVTSDSALRITVARWLGPDGVQIPLEGINPDVKVESVNATSSADVQLKRAIELISSNENK